MKMKQNVRKNILYKMMNPAAPTLVSRGCPYFSYERNANAACAYFLLNIPPHHSLFLNLPKYVTIHNSKSASTRFRSTDTCFVPLIPSEAAPELFV